MGNGVAKNPCFFSVAGDSSSAAAGAAVTSETFPYDTSLGHSFFYAPSAAAAADTEEDLAAVGPAFWLSGAAISANPATPPLPESLSLINELTWSSANSFESSRSFAAAPLQAAPRLSVSGPLLSVSGPFSEASISGPLDHPPSSSSSSFSSIRLQRSLSQIVAERRAARSRRRSGRSFLRFFSRAASKLRFKPRPPHRKKPNETEEPAIKIESCAPSNGAEDGHGDEHCWPEINGNVQWAQGMAGEDRFHVVVAEEHCYVFVGIYDGFNGPDATNFLFANLYTAVHQELKGLLWDEENQEAAVEYHGNSETDCCEEDGRSSERNRELSEANQKLKEQPRRSGSGIGIGICSAALHGSVLKALAQALKRTEDAYFEAADRRAMQNPELALMGSCVLVMLMKGKDVYVMNVGDSRAVLAQKNEPDLKNILGKATQDLERFKLEIMRQLQAYEMDELSGLQALQLTAEHSTNVDEEVNKIRYEHPDDPSAVVNGRVKGKLKVTRAFGAGYLKQPKWNRTLLEAFKIDYVGTTPYISCVPSLRHHRISPKDRFLVLSSDGLYQYFTNKEVVDQVELYIATNPDCDPAQFLLEEVVIRAAREAGMDCHELLDIPQGDRRKYHDDVSIIIISFEGRIWRSSM